MSCYNDGFKYYRKGQYEMGLMKDESPLSLIVEGLSLKDKLYGYKKESDQVKCKGVNDINFESLETAVFNNEMITTKLNTIKSAKDCKIYSYTDHKILMAYTDKCYLYNKTMSYPYGHYMINTNYEDLL